MTFPAPFTVGLHSFYQGTDDGYGNPTAPNYDPPLDQPGTEYKVLGWADLFLPSAAEVTGNRERVIEFKQLFAPASFPAGPYDRIDIEDGQYEVVGQPTDHMHGPWWNPNIKMYEIQRVTG